jgi:hypothetical protein
MVHCLLTSEAVQWSEAKILQGMATKRIPAPFHTLIKIPVHTDMKKSHIRKINKHPQNIYIQKQKRKEQCSGWIA